MKLSVIFIFTIFLFLSCGSQDNSRKQNEKIQNPESDSVVAKPQDDFYLELTTIPGEPGLEDYAKGAKKIKGSVLKQLKGSDGSEYYLFKTDDRLKYTFQGKSLETDYLIIGGRFVGGALKRGANKTVINIAIVRDESLIKDAILDFDKSIFIGMGEATEISKLESH